MRPVFWGGLVEVRQYKTLHIKEKKMVKKSLLVVALAAIAAGGAFAQERYNSYAPGIDKSKVLINAGVGYGLLSSGYDMGIPPITVSADFKLPVAVPITVGPFLGIASRTFETKVYGDPGYKFTYTDIAIGVRGMYHFNFAKNLDTYAGLVLGYVINSSTAEYTGNWPSGFRKPDPTDYSYFLWGGNIGARYFFTNNIGAYLELGYSGLQFVSLGLSIKF